MRIAITLASLVCVTAYGGGGPVSPEYIVFVSKEKGIKGNSAPVAYRASHVKSCVGPLACTSGKIVSFAEVSP